MNEVRLSGVIGEINCKQDEGKIAVCRGFIRVPKYTKDSVPAYDQLKFVSFGERALRMYDQLHRGTFCVLLGRLNVSSFDRDGDTVSTTDLVIDRWATTETFELPLGGGQ